MTEDKGEDITLDETVDEDEVAPEPVTESVPAAEPSSAEGADEPTARRRDRPERMASEAEIKELRKLNADPRTKRMVRRWFIAGIVAVGVFIFAQYRLSLTESVFTWPGAYDYNFDDGSITFAYRNVDPAFELYFPNCEGMRGFANPSNMTAAVETKIGRYYECPFVLAFSSHTISNWWDHTLQESFAAWKKKQTDAGWRFQSATEHIGFIKTNGAGWPAIEGDYFRPHDGNVWAGSFIYFRDNDRDFVCIREVRSRDWTRALNVIRNERCFKINNTLCSFHFEVPEKITEGDPTRLLRRVRNMLSHNFAMAQWNEIEQNIKSLIVRAKRDNDRALLNDAFREWLRFRAEQEIWYNRRAFSFICAVREGNGFVAHQIRKEALDKFNAWDDVRRKKILRGFRGN